MKSSLEEVRLKPQYTLTLELTEQEVQDLYLLLHHDVPSDTKEHFRLNDEEFGRVKDTNSKIFGIFREAVQKINEYWQD